MARLSKSAVAEFFVSGARPTQSQFEDLIDSYQDFSDFLQEMATALATKTGVVSVSGSATSAHTVLPVNLGGTGAGTAASAVAELGLGAGLALVASANQFTKENTFISSAFSRTVNTTGSAANPAMNFDRRATAVGGQNLGVIRFKGRDSLFASSTYSKIGGAVVSTSAGGETGRLQFTTVVSGASADRFMIAGGMYSLAASGGDRGIGTINVQEYYDDGERVETSKLDTEQATTTGTSFDFTSPFATVTKVEVLFRGTGLDGSENILVQVGPSGGVVTSGYVSGSAAVNAGAQTYDTSTAGMILAIGSQVATGIMTLVLSDAVNNDWVASHSADSTTAGIVGAGDISLSGVLNKLTILDTGGDSFDAGSVNVRWTGY